MYSSSTWFLWLSMELFLRIFTIQVRDNRKAVTTKRQFTWYKEKSTHVSREEASRAAVKDVRKTILAPVFRCQGVEWCLRSLSFRLHSFLTQTVACRLIEAVDNPKYMNNRTFLPTHPFSFFFLFWLFFSCTFTFHLFVVHWSYDEWLKRREILLLWFSSFEESKFSKRERRGFLWLLSNEKRENLLCVFSKISRATCASRISIFLLAFDPEKK